MGSARFRVVRGGTAQCAGLRKGDSAWRRLGRNGARRPSTLLASAFKENLSTDSWLAFSVSAIACGMASDIDTFYDASFGVGDVCSHNTALGAAFFNPSAICASTHLETRLSARGRSSAQRKRQRSALSTLYRLHSACNAALGGRSTALSALVTERSTLRNFQLGLRSRSA
eukprot:2877568-Pleurochrysis_carterae.AAC.1